MNPQLTIRDYIARRARVCAIVTFGMLFSMPVLIAYTGGKQPAPPWMVVPFLLIFGTALRGEYFIRCPRCKNRWSRLAFRLAFRVFAPRIRFCPFCGVDIDEPATPVQPRPDELQPNQVSGTRVSARETNRHPSRLRVLEIAKQALMWTAAAIAVWEVGV